MLLPRDRHCERSTMSQLQAATSRICPRHLKMMLGCLGVLLLIVAPVSLQRAAAAERVPVRVVQVEAATTTLEQRFPGVTRASERITVRSQINGRIETRAVELGEAVEAGQILLQLYSPGAAASAAAAQQQWQQAQVQVAQAQRDFERVRRLQQQGVASEQSFDSAQSALAAARAAADAAQALSQQAAAQTAEQVIRAPFAGVITATPVEPGEVIQAGQALLQLADPNRVELEVTLSQRVASALTVGTRVEVELLDHLPPQATTGVVTAVTRFRERGALPAAIIQLQGAEVQPGMTAQAHLQVPQPEHFVLPLSAVVRRGTHAAGVYRVIEENKVELVSVVPSTLTSHAVYVSGDLQAADTVVTAGTQQLYDGAAVQVVP